MIRHVAVIDLGKTNSKVALVDTNTATEIQVIKQPSVANSNTLYLSLDHEATRAFVFYALRELHKKWSVDAITVTTHGATAALLDDRGKLALPVLDYEFTDVDDRRSEYEEHRPLFAETGSPALPGGLNIGAQLFWQQSNFPDLFSGVQTVLTWPQFWVHLLTGVRHNDVTSLGCHTDLYEPRRQRYSTLVDTMKWRPLMPSAKHSGQLAGYLQQPTATELEMPVKLPVYTGIHDSNASLVPHLITQSAPFSVVSTGTWFIVMAMGGADTALDETRDTLLNVNARGESVPSARFMGGRERELLQVTSPCTDQDIDTLLDTVESPAMLLPSVVPDTGPYPNAQMQWLGQSVDNKPSFKSGVVALYLALMTHECMQMVGCKGPTYVEGPLAQDKLFTQMLAAVSQRPTYISASVTGTSVGAAMLIQKPTQLTAYEQVHVKTIRRTKMERYARQWQQALHNHGI